MCVIVQLPDGTACPDGELCNGNETCVEGECLSGDPVECPEGQECFEDLQGMCGPSPPPPVPRTPPPTPSPPPTVPPITYPILIFGLIGATLLLGLVLIPRRRHPPHTHHHEDFIATPIGDPQENVVSGRRPRRRRRNAEEFKF